MFQEWFVSKKEEAETNNFLFQRRKEEKHETFVFLFQWFVSEEPLKEGFVSKKEEAGFVSKEELLVSKEETALLF